MESITSKHPWLLTMSGWIILLGFWFGITDLELINPRILPSPQKTLAAIIKMSQEDDLFRNILFSIKINLAGYIKCIIMALIVGFSLGLNKTIRKMFSAQINAIRFVPITALMGIFIAMSGLTITTKINFLAFGIWVYLVPVVVQRISEVYDIHLQMMKTLGASWWQTLRYVQWPSTMSRLSDDIRILVGISWTYIIIAELTGIQGGLGSLIFLGGKQSNPGMVYGIMFIIVGIGICQDGLFRLIDFLLFRHKHK